MSDKLDYQWDELSKKQLIYRIVRSLSAQHQWLLLFVQNDSESFGNETTQLI